MENDLKEIKETLARIQIILELMMNPSQVKGYERICSERGLDE